MNPRPDPIGSNHPTQSDRNPGLGILTEPTVTIRCLSDDIQLSESYRISDSYNPTKFRSNPMKSSTDRETQNSVDEKFFKIHQKILISK